MTNLQSLFDSLTQPPQVSGDAHFAVLPIAESVRHLVGKDRDGFPAVLVDASSDGATLLRVELEHLTVLPDLRCEVAFPDGEHRAGTYTLIRCSGDHELQELFLRLMGSLIDQMGDSSDRSELAQVVLRLVDMFRALAMPARRSVQGLWAELFVIAQASDPRKLLAAWHADPSELYDFNDEEQKLEVKSSSDRTRIHRVSLEQLSPPYGTTVVLVSIITEPAGGGATVEDLVGEISHAIGPSAELQLKLRTIVTETLGADWRAAARQRFDRAQAAASCAMFLCADVPRIDPETIPDGVAHVEFDVSLDAVRPMDARAKSEMGGLVGAAIPGR